MAWMASLIACIWSGWLTENVDVAVGDMAKDQKPRLLAKSRAPARKAAPPACRAGAMGFETSNFVARIDDAAGNS